MLEFNTLVLAKVLPIKAHLSMIRHTIRKGRRKTIRISVMNGFGDNSNNADFRLL
jgi:hypothetical protein